HLLLYSQIEAVLAAFEAAGIRLLVLKGPVNADDLYGRSAWRPMVDLDLLVHEADWERSLALLGGLGFSAEGSTWSGLTEQLTGQVAMLKPLGPMVAAIELHRDLRILSERLAVRGEVSLPRAWEEAEPYTCGRAHAWRLSREDALAYASTHWAQHHFYGSIWLVDIALMAARGDLSWDKLVRQAESDGVASFVWAALFMAQLLFAAPVPPEVLTALQPPFPKATIIKHLVWKKTLQGFREEADGRSILLQLMLFASWRWTVAGLMSGMWPSAQWLRQHYEPDGKTPRHRLLLRHWGNLLRLVRG
ncbi:MAG TPA: nucleotidyltransferase family protein, partial [Oscillatoriaceae cyanobacterium]